MKEWALANPGYMIIIVLIIIFAAEGIVENIADTIKNRRKQSNGN